MNKLERVIKNLFKHRYKLKLGSHIPSKDAFFDCETVRFNSTIQLSKGTWTEEYSDMEYFATKQPKEWRFLPGFSAKYSFSESSAVQVPLLNWTGESNPTVCKKKKR